MDRDRMSRQVHGSGAMTRLRLFSIAALAVFTAGLAVALLGSGGETGLEAERASAAAKQKRITGKLSNPAYTVIALAPNGEAKTDLAAVDSSFSLAPPAGSVTLHLRAPDGTYGGPIVFEEKWNPVREGKKQVKKAKKRVKNASGKKTKRKAKKNLKKARSNLKKAKKRASGKQVVLGVDAGAQLGTVNVKVAKGYAKVKLNKRQWKKWVSEKSKARGKDGVPIGAGNFGRVRSNRTDGGADLDRDGVPNPLDIDDDGDLVLDNIDRSPVGTSARASQSTSGDFSLSPWLIAMQGHDQTVNANAPGLSDEQIEAALPSFGFLTIGHAPGTSIELDCGQPQGSANPGLAYCSAGGVGTITGKFPLTPFPGCCDPDGNGFGSLYPSPPGPGGPVSTQTQISHNATSEQIRSGDVLIQRIGRTDGSEEEKVATLQYVFETNPALVSYDDGQGNSQTLSYPTPGDSFPVKAGPSGDVIVELTAWRPQRRPIPPETGDWYDIGGLDYNVAALKGSPVGAAVNICKRDSYSTTDPNLAPTQISPSLFGGGDGFRDLSEDQPASPNNTFTFKVNFTKCLAPLGLTLDPGENQELVLGASANAGEGELLDRTAVFFTVEGVP